MSVEAELGLRYPVWFACWKKLGVAELTRAVVTKRARWGNAPDLVRCRDSYEVV